MNFVAAAQALPDAGAVDSPSDGVTPGLVLRAWRQHAGLTMQNVADAVIAADQQTGRDGNIRSKGTIANWEKGERSPTPESVGRFAEALGLSPEEKDALVGMWRAAGSATALPPRVYWQHNYREGGGPVWLWLRRAHGSQPVTVAAGWGPFGTSFEVPPTASGAVVHGPASLPNPPVQITFEEPGWADFGNGVIPQGVIDRLSIHALEGAGVFEGRFDDPPELTAKEAAGVAAALSSMMAVGTNISVLWTRFKGQMGAMRPNSAVFPLSGASIVMPGWEGVLQTDDRGELISQLILTPHQIKQIREDGRNLSAKSAAQAANDSKLLGNDGQITDNQIETLERSGHLPPLRHIIARLDHAYGLDGYLGIERTVSSRTAWIDSKGALTIEFPDFWVGPIWLQMHAPADGRPSAEATLDLYWGYWRRLQHVRHGTIVTTRKAAPSRLPALKVRLPRGWRLAAGTGVVPGAIDINRDWYPRSWPAAAQQVFEGFNTVAKAGHIPGLTTAEPSDDQ